MSLVFNMKEVDLLHFQPVGRGITVEIDLRSLTVGFSLKWKSKPWHKTDDLLEFAKQYFANVLRVAHRVSGGTQAQISTSSLSGSFSTTNDEICLSTGG
jgi:hypothetical protein